MKHVRGFGYVGDVAEEECEEEYEELDYIELEHGFGAEHVEERREVKAYNCPRCKRFLFEADVSLHGVIYIRCRRCKREVAVETEPTMQRIGFINPLQRKEN